jgi:hypothetical protein
VGRGTGCTPGDDVGAPLTLSQFIFASLVAVGGMV